MLFFSYLNSTGCDTRYHFPIEKSHHFAELLPRKGQNLLKLKFAQWRFNYLVWLERA